MRLHSFILILIPASGLLGQSQTFTTDGTYTAKRFEPTVIVEAWGGGGGGGGGDGGSANGAGGGGGGAYAKGRVTGLVPGTGYTVDVGAAGGGGASGSDGTPGADSTFNTTGVVAKGGAQGIRIAGTRAGGAGGQASASTGDIAKYNGGAGINGRTSSTGRGGWGGSSGGTAANGITNAPAAWQEATFPAAQVPAGAGVGGNGGNANGASGVAPANGNGGGGGGGAEGTTSGGNGTAGKIIVYRVRKFNTT